MMQPRFFLLGALLAQFACEAYAMTCPLPLGLELNCPTMFNDDDKAFCCHSADNVPYCCDIADYIKNNSAIIAGILVGALILLIIVILCCCCFCSCCLLAKRRVNRGTVLYAPVTPQPVVSPSIVAAPVTTPAAYPTQAQMMVHVPPPSSSNPPPPYPYKENWQPAVNPYYKD